MVLFVDHQAGVANGVQTQSPAEFINNVKALGISRKSTNSIDHHEKCGSTNPQTS
ncbi:hypothetical protein [Bradyrhizobium sp. Ash2021]|uniref:hypothetical protein n=1 Tax=Bradyrhizobium sp. Ash2021 TaxID=2954771 RepID=UPI0028161D8B|nr:hypothetical protein [Bradyrhizobium sp. Ash2021]WMT76393.1 hypothetical protein NL528_08520 [Bradyrhizobium sp. Ash2021]